jgi:nitroreductase
MRGVRETWRLFQNYLYDFRRYWKHSSVVFTGTNQARARALITMAYHGIEKALALPNPRPGFGRQLAELLIWRLQRYVSAFGHDQLTENALCALESYIAFQKEWGIDVANIKASVDQLRGKGVRSEAGALNEMAVRTVTREEFLHCARKDLLDFFSSRHSVRHFANREVERDVIQAAVQMAQAAPSACNRQPARVLVVWDKKRIQGVLEIQGGARGFADEIPLLFVITSDLCCWQSAGERYEGWIDGALFAMTLVWALHSLGLVSCMLNWAKLHQTDRQLRRYLCLPESEMVVVLIAAGYPAERFRVTRSPRHALEEILRFDGTTAVSKSGNRTGCLVEREEPGGCDEGL